MDYMNALEGAWSELIKWKENGLFVPENEESIQCFLYRGIVNHLGSAVGVRSKPTHGVLGNGDMNFPDFVLGEPKQVIVEIKYARGNASILGSCKTNIEKMRKLHFSESVKRVFILYDEHPGCVFLNQEQKDILQDVDRSCRILHYPFAINPHKSAALKAWAKMRSKKLKEV